MVISGTLPLTTSSGRRRRRSRMIHLILEAPDQLPQPAVKAVEAIPVSGGCSPRHGEGAAGPHVALEVATLGGVGGDGGPSEDSLEIPELGKELMDPGPPIEL